MPVTPTNETGDIALAHACRSAIGDRLRTVSVCSDGNTQTVYRRGDLSHGADTAVHEEVTADDVVLADGGRTVDEFDQGYVTHVRVGETGVVVTTDGLKMDRQTEISAAVRGILSDA